MSERARSQLVRRRQVLPQREQQGKQQQERLFLARQESRCCPIHSVSLVDYPDLPSHAKAVEALIVDDVLGVRGHRPVDPAVLTGTAGLAGQAQAVPIALKHDQCHVIRAIDT